MLLVSRIRTRVSSGAARNVLPWNVLVAARLARQAEHALAQDVAHHLGSSAFDRIGAGTQELILREAGSRFARARGRATARIPRLVDERIGSHHVHRAFPD